MDAREHAERSPVVGASKPRLLRVLGPGLISGAANDYPGPLLQVSVALLLVANVFAISADLGAMADVLRLLVGGPHLLHVLLFGGLCVILQIYMQYTRYVAVLKWTTLSLFAYFGAVAMVDVPWSEVWAAIVAPPVAFDLDHLSMAVAIFGVALSPYIYFWQSSQEAEDQRVKPKRDPLVQAPEQAPEAMERIRLETYVGMALAIWSVWRSSSPLPPPCTATGRGRS